MHRLLLLVVIYQAHRSGALARCGGRSDGGPEEEGDKEPPLAEVVDASDESLGTADRETIPDGIVVTEADRPGAGGVHPSPRGRRAAAARAAAAAIRRHGGRGRTSPRAAPGAPLPPIAELALQTRPPAPPPAPPPVGARP